MFNWFKTLSLKIKALIVWALASTGLFVFYMSASTAILSTVGADVTTTGATSGTIAILFMSMFGGLALTFILGVASFVIPIFIGVFGSRKS